MRRSLRGAEAAAGADLAGQQDGRRARPGTPNARRAGTSADRICAPIDLRDAEHDAADQRSPQRADAADHHRLEGEDKLHRPGIGIEGGAHGQQRAGQRRPSPRRCRRRCRRPSRELMPTSSAVSASSAVARMARPSGVCVRNSCSPPSSNTASAKISAAS